MIPVNPSAAPLLSALRSLTPWLLGALLIAALSALIRYQLIESTGWTGRCAEQPWQGWCTLRSATIELFLQQRIGWVAALLGVLSAVTRRRDLAGIALFVASAAVALYAVEPGAFGGLLGLVILASTTARTRSRAGKMAASPITAANDSNPSA